MVTESKTSLPALKPLLALWGLGGVVGLPTLLFALGYLSYKGHTTLLPLPSHMLAASAEYLVFTGGLFLVVSLRAFVHWPLVLALAVVLLYQLARRFDLVQWYEERRTFNGVGRLLALLLLAAVIVTVTVELISYRSATLGALPAANESPDLLKQLFEDEANATWRAELYRSLCVLELLIGWGLLWLLKVEVKTPEPHTAAAWHGLHFAALVLAVIALLCWPLCYGRLQLPYVRPEVKIQLQRDDKTTEVKDDKATKVKDDKATEVKGLVLNPHHDGWTVVVCCPTAPCRYHNFEVKDLRPYEITGWKNIFSYAACTTR